METVSSANSQPGRPASQARKSFRSSLGRGGRVLFRIILRFAKFPSLLLAEVIGAGAKPLEGSLPIGGMNRARCLRGTSARI